MPRHLAEIRHAVRAVNSYAKLLTACNGARDAYESAESELPGWIEAIDAAIADATAP